MGPGQIMAKRFRTDARDDLDDFDSEEADDGLPSFPPHPDLVDITTPSEAGCLRLLGVREVSLSSGSVWPETTTAACHWCCHGFPWTPIGAPVDTDDRGRFVLRGIFCSFNCAKAHLWHSDTPRKARRIDLLMQLALRLYGGPKRGGAYRGIVMAPPRQALRMFGGWMTIDEFRRSVAQYETVKILNHQNIVVERPTRYGLRPLSDRRPPSHAAASSSHAPDRPDEAKERRERLHEAAAIRVAMAAAHNDDSKTLDAYIDVRKRSK